MKINKKREIIFHKIKVNKKERNNRFNNSQKNFNISNKYDYSSNSSSPNNSNIISHYNNYGNVPYVIIKNYKPNSNSEEKLLKNNINKENTYLYNRETNNIIKPEIRYKQSIIKHENSDGNILFFDNLNNNNINNKRNKRKIYRKILDSDNLEYNKNNNLSIKTTYLNNYNNNIITGENFKTIENNKINNYINEFNLINNYYENNYKNNFNRQTYNNKYILNRSLDNKRQNYFINDNPKNNQKYIINHTNNNNYNYKIKLRNTINNINNEVNNFDLNNYYNNYKNIKQKNIYNRFQNQNIYIKSKSPYGRNEFLIEYNNNYKENNYKKLFSIYRGKLIQEFMRHFKRTINFFLLRELKNIKNFIDNNNFRNKNNYIFFPKKRKKDSNHNNIKKINNLSKIDNNYYADEEIQKSNKVIDKKYIKLFYSEKKNPVEVGSKQVLTSRNDLNIRQKNINKIMKETINNQIIPKDSNYLIFSNRLIKCGEKEPIKKLNYSQSREIKRKNSSIDKNNKNNNFIYKKKIKLNKKNALNIKKEKGRIIDIDINLGKPLKEISDMSLIRNFEMNNKNKKENKNKKRAKTRKKYSLPKKKYLEEEYDNEHNISFPYKTYSYDNKKYRKNNLININKDMEKDQEDIIITKDKLLSIRIKNLFSIINNNRNKEHNYYNNILKIKKNENFSIYSDSAKYKHISFYSLTELNNLRNINEISFEQNKKDKYLLSCVKFIIRVINKIFLDKEYIHFKNCIYLDKQ